MAATPLSQQNIIGIVFCVVAGVIIAFIGLGWCYVAKRRNHPPSDEESAANPSLNNGGKAPFPNLKSAFSPDEKRISQRFERIRQAFLRRKKPEDSLLPVHRVQSPPDTIERPLPALPRLVNRLPVPLDRGTRPPRRSPPPPLNAGAESPEMLETIPSSDSDSTTSNGSHTHKLVQSARVKVPPQAVLVPVPGRPLPGFSGAKTAWLRPPKSPSRRRSWLSKQPFKHPFVPLRTPDVTLRFPLGSPLTQYQPSRQHLEARATRSPRVDGKRRLASPRTPQSARRPAPASDEDDVRTKQARLVDALHDTVMEGEGTPTGHRHAPPPVSSKNPSSGIRFADPPTTAYI